MYDIDFRGAEHEDSFYLFLKQFDVNPSDTERVSLFYLLSLSEDCRNNITDLYDRENRCINIDALHHGWVTSSDTRIIRLAFNLFNGGVPTALEESSDTDDNLYYKNGQFAYDANELLKSLPVNIFCDAEYGKYFVNALKLRFPDLQDD